jgi:hypothetical protein
LVFALLSVLVFDKPSVLPFIALLLIPLIVHLFNLRRTKKVVFSNTAILKKVREESSAKRKPKELLILISRMLTILFLVLAFALPTLKNDDQRVVKDNEVIIYLDNSPSMQQVYEGVPRIDEAVRYAQYILDAYPEGTKFHFIENGYSNSILTDYTKQSLADLLAQTNVVGVGRELGEVIGRIQGSGIRGDVYLISDFSELQYAVPLDTLNTYFLSDVYNDKSDNLYIDTVYLENTFLSGAFSNQLNINIQSNTRAEKEPNLRVYFDDNLSGTVKIDVAGTGEGIFEIPDGQEGLEKIRLELDDPAVTFDNSFYLSINSLQLTNVVEVYDQGSTRYISKLFDDNEYFNFSRINSTNLDNQKLAAADIIIVNGVSLYSNQLKNELNKALIEGVNVTIIPPVNFGSAALLDFGARMISDDDQKVQLSAPDFANPFFDGVFIEENVNMQMPFATTTYRLLNPEYDLLTYLNGRPFLSKVATDYNLFVFTTPFVEDKTSFINHALFVPVFYRLALGSQRSFSSLYHYTDSETILFPLPRTSGTAIYQINGAENLITPDQRVMNGQLIMTIPKDELSPGTAAIQEGEEILGYISFNQSKSESVFNPNVTDILNEMASADQVNLMGARDASSFGEMLESSLNGRSLWKWALGLALFFLFVEIILIRYL